jgi:photosystem II stability/assembly factor-like uncharacterized protein
MDMGALRLHVGILMLLPLLAPTGCISTNPENPVPPDPTQAWTKTQGAVGEARSLVSSGSRLFVAAGSDGVARSQDSGASWTFFNGGLPLPAYVNAVSNFGGEVFAGTKNSGVFRSSDAGRSWIPVNHGLPDIAGAGDLLLGGVFLSKDKGYSWTQMNSGLPANPYVRSLVVCGEYLIAGALSTDSAHSIWRLRLR